MLVQDVSVPISFDASDRRESNRVSYDTTLGVAPFDGQTIPTANCFCRVHGSDLSHTGISYLSSSWPASDSVVLQLGNREKPVFAAAKIVGCLSRRSDIDDTVRFEVRCEFFRWL